jgi:hypothetical protein
MADELGILQHYWGVIFLIASLIYDRLIVYLHHAYGYPYE